MARYGVSTGGGVKAEWSFDLEERLRKAAQAFPGTVRQEIERAVDGLLDSARERWPVARERSRANPVPSRDRLFATIEASETALAGIVVSPAPYTIFIKSYKGGLGGKAAWVELVRKPAKGVALALGRKLLSGSVLGER